PRATMAPGHARRSDRTDRQAAARAAEAGAAPRPPGTTPAVGRREPPDPARLRLEPPRGEPSPGAGVPGLGELLRRTRGLGDRVETGPGHGRRGVLQGPVAARRGVDPSPPGEPARGVHAAPPRRRPHPPVPGGASR